jgi:hypothetical protein
MDDGPDILAALLDAGLAAHGGIALVDRRAALTYRTTMSRAAEITHGLLATGVAPGDVVAVVAPVSVETAYAELGILAAGAVVLPLAAGAPGEAALGARLAIVGSADTAERIAGVLGTTAVFVIDDLGRRAFAPLDLLAARGIAWAASNRAAATSRRRAIGAATIATVDVGLGGGVSHGTWGRALAAAPALTASGERILLRAPLDDGVLRLTQYAALAGGACLAFAEPGIRLETAIARFDPASLVGTVDDIETLAFAVRSRIDQATGIRRAIVRHAVGVRQIGRGAIGRSLRVITCSGRPSADAIDALDAIGVDVVHP